MNKWCCLVCKPFQHQLSQLNESMKRRDNHYMKWRYLITEFRIDEMIMTMKRVHFHHVQPRVLQPRDSLSFSTLHIIFPFLSFPTFVCTLFVFIFCYLPDQSPSPLCFIFFTSFIFLFISARYKLDLPVVGCVGEWIRRGWQGNKGGESCTLKW